MEPNCGVSVPNHTSDEIPIHVLTVPPGYKEGDCLEFSAPNGIFMKTNVPAGKVTGDVFDCILTNQAVYFLTVTVPAGSAGGTTLDFNDLNGQLYRTAIPEGLNEGDSFQVQMYLPVQADSPQQKFCHKQITCAKCSVTYMSASGTSTLCPQCR